MADDTPDKARSQNVSQRDSSKPQADDITSSIVATNGNSKVFNFFGLPRELRDKIYEQPTLVEHEKLTPFANDDTCFLMKAKKLRTSLLLINRQFKREYGERCSGKQVLCLKDHPDVSEYVEVVPALNKAQYWHIDYSVVCWRPDLFKVHYQISWLERFLSEWIPLSPTLHSISIKLYLPMFLCIPELLVHIERQLSGILAVDRVKLLEVYGRKHTDLDVKSSEPRTLFARWERDANAPAGLVNPPIASEEPNSEWEDQESEEMEH